MMEAPAPKGPGPVLMAPMPQAFQTAIKPPRPLKRPRSEKMDAPTPPAPPLPQPPKAKAMSPPPSDAARSPSPPQARPEDTRDASDSPSDSSPTASEEQSAIWAYIGRKYYKKLMQIDPDEEKEFSVREALLLRSLQARYARAFSINAALRTIHESLSHADAADMVDGKPEAAGKVAAASGRNRKEEGADASAGSSPENSDSDADEASTSSESSGSSSSSKSTSNGKNFGTSEKHALDMEVGARPAKVARKGDGADGAVRGPIDIPAMMSIDSINAIKGVMARQHSFVITDPHFPDNPIIFASPGFLEMTGYSREDVLGRNCRFLQGPSTDKQTVGRLRKGIRCGHETTEMLINYRANGEPFWNQLHVAPIYNGSGSVRYFVGVCCDVTTLERDGLDDAISRSSKVSSCSSDATGGASSSDGDVDEADSPLRDDTMDVEDAPKSLEAGTRQ
mmetsp:Transcript_27738/g.88051  ORF Transcript_27738/g.88051 Transcript_27738/m.88051 type:complete len:451 (-) Transcript_27738:2950-4302(-)